MQIITVGWGYKDLAFAKKGDGHRCSVCGHKWGKGAAAEHNWRYFSGRVSVCESKKIVSCFDLSLQHTLSDLS